MDALMQLVVGWPLVGAFVFTVVVTCLSLVGWVRFMDPGQQKKLFQVVVVELLVGAGGLASGALRLDPGAVGSEVWSDGRLAGAAEAVDRMVGECAVDRVADPAREAAVRAVEEVELPRGSPAAARRGQLFGELRRAPDSAEFRSALRDVPFARGPSR